jgi:hypothetical protein
MLRKHLSRTSFAAAVVMAIGLSAGPPALAADPSCQPLLHASEKQISTPNHVYMTTTREGKARAREVIFAGDSIYVMANGKWNRSPLTPQKIQEMQADISSQAKSMTCHYLRDEPVNGEAAAVYGTARRAIPDSERRHRRSGSPRARASRCGRKRTSASVGKWTRATCRSATSTAR